jgi:hypothetical protein
MLKTQLDKVHDFQKQKVNLYQPSPIRPIRSTSSVQTAELSRRIRDAEKDVHKLVAQESAQSPSPSPTRSSDPESHQARPSDYGPDEGSDDDDDMDDNQSDASLEDLFHDLQEEVATLVADVHDLALFTKLNITGFLKILKVRSFAALFCTSPHEYFSPQKHDVRFVYFIACLP